MKTLIANILIVVTIFTGTVTLAFANSSAATINNTANTATTPAMFSVSAYGTRYHTYSVYAGEEVEIILDGDGSTDLDMFIYDSNGNLIASRTGYGDSESSVLDIYRNTRLTVKVVNRGSVYNDYSLSVYAN